MRKLLPLLYIWAVKMVGQFLLQRMREDGERNRKKKAYEKRKSEKKYKKSRSTGIDEAMKKTRSVILLKVEKISTKIIDKEKDQRVLKKQEKRRLVKNQKSKKS